MRPDDSQLIAYADGELSASDATSVKQALAASPDLRQSVELLRASRLPYREAFATQKLPPLPDELRRRIEAEASAAMQEADHAKPRPTSRPQRRLWLAAAFFSGAFCAGLVQQLGVGRPTTFGNRTAMVAPGEPRSWISVAADYQQMYTRDTVANVTPDPAVSAETANAIREIDRIQLRVPDLRPVGLSFKSVERLRYNGHPLVQIEYLPGHGVPIALCVMKDSQPDQPIGQRQLNGMTVVSWRQNELSYALIGKPDSGDLRTIARKISNADVDAMFGGGDIVQPTPG